MSKGITLWRYRRPFDVGEQKAAVVLFSRTKGLASELRIGGAVVVRDWTPLAGPGAVRNHALTAELEDGSRLDVEAGWVSIANVGIAARHDGKLIHESHPGRTIAYPENYREATMQSKATNLREAVEAVLHKGMAESAAKDDSYDGHVWKRNKIPLGIDIGLGLLFFIIAKLTDLTTAAIVGAVIGLMLLAAQRITKVDLLGGLAMFGIIMMLLSAGLALAFQSDDAVKYRTTALGLLSATLFFSDGLLGGKRLARRLMRYLPYTDIDPGRLGIGMGLMGAIMAGLNLVIALYTSTDIWLFYTTFGDFPLAMGSIILVFLYARGQMLPNVPPRYNAKQAAAARSE